MAIFNASTRTSSGVTWAPGASDALANWLNSKSWTGQFQDWAVDSDGDLESIVWSSDGRSTLSFYLSGWRQSGLGFNASGLAFQVLDDLGGADNRAAAFWDGNIYLSRDFKTMTGTVIEIQETMNDGNPWYASGSWDASRLYSGTPDQVISYMFSGSDQITGSRFADTINSGSGDDNITGGGGDDFIDGGTGTDKTTFSGAFSGYSFGKDSSGRIVVSDLTAGRDGRDTITGVETLVFSDKEISASTLFQPEQPSSDSFSFNELRSFTRAWKNGANKTAIRPKANSKTIIGTDDDDNLNATTEAKGLKIEGRGGDDVIGGSKYKDKIYGGRGADFISLPKGSNKDKDKIYLEKASSPYEADAILGLQKIDRLYIVGGSGQISVNEIGGGLGIYDGGDLCGIYIGKDINAATLAGMVSSI